MRETVTLPTMQHRLETRDLLWALVLSAPFLATHLLTPVKLPWPMLVLVVTYPLLMAGLLLIQWHARVRPGRYCVTLTVTDSGVELTRPVGRKIVMPFSEVQRVVATSVLDAEYGEPTTTLVIYTGRTKLSIGGELLYGLNLLDRIRHLPGFDAHAYASHDAEEGSLWRCLVPKRTDILRRTA